MPLTIKKNIQTPLVTDGADSTTLPNVQLLNLPLATSGSKLSTTDPGVSGQLWNDAGTVKVSS